MRLPPEKLRQAIPDVSTRTRTLLATAGLLIGLALVSRVFYLAVWLDEAAYRSFSITLAAMTTPKLAVPVLVPAAVVVWLRRGLRWGDVPDGPLVRIVLLAAAGTLVVSLAFYEPNWFLGRSHLVDRALLVGLFVLVVWRPIALVPFIILAGVMTFQFAVPLGRYTLNDKRLVVDVVILFCLATGAGIMHRAGGVRAFIGAVGVLLVSWYLVAAVGKINLRWLQREELANMTRSAHLIGWLPGSTAGRVAELVARTDWLLIPAAIVVELATILFLLGRRPALAALLALPGLHLMVFLLSGIFFWKWMILEAALIVLVVRCRKETFSTFGPALVILALPFAFLSPRLFGVATLAWYDTSYSVNLELEAVGTSGAVYRVDRDDMAPYELLLTQGRLGFLARPGIVIGSSGTALSWEVASRIRQARTASDISEIEGQYAVSQYREASALVFDRFVRTRFQHWSDQPPLRPPHHIESGRAPAFMNVPPIAFAGQEEVAEVRVRMHKVWWDGQSYRPLADCIIRAVPIAEPLRPSYVAPETACAI